MNISNPSKWMSTMDGHLTLNEICIPATHDSGMYTAHSVTHTIPRPEALARTQKFNVKEQLDIGIRYFDFRVERRLEFRGHILRIVHSPGKGFLERIGNLYADDLKRPLRDIRDFLDNEGKNETVILRFSHFNMNKKKGTELFLEYIDKYVKKYLLDKFNVVKGRELNNIPLNDLRGKLVVIIEQNEDDFDYDKIEDKNIYKLSDFMLIYDSYANSDNYETMKSNQILKFQIVNNNELFCLDWTLTMQNIEQATYWSIEKQANNINPKIINPDKWTEKYLLNPNQNEQIINFLSVDYAYPWTLEVCKRIYDNRNNRVHNDIDVFENCDNNFIVDNNLVYFSAFSSLYKHNLKSGSTLKLDNNSFGGIAVDEEYVYFKGESEKGGLWRVKKNGSGSAIKIDNNCEGMAIAVDKNNVYFRAYNELWKKQKDGSGSAIKIDNNCYGDIVIDDEYVYFKGESEKGGLWRVKKDGSSSATKVDNNCEGKYIAIDKNNVYFRAYNELWKKQKDGSGSAIKIDNNCYGGIATDMKDDGYVYFSAFDGELWRTKKDGEANAEKLFPLRILDNDTPIHVMGGFAFGVGYGRDSKLFRIRIE